MGDISGEKTCSYIFKKFKSWKKMINMAFIIFKTTGITIQFLIALVTGIVVYSIQFKFLFFTVANQLISIRHFKITTHM